VDRQVEKDLAAALPLAGELLPLVVHLADVVTGQKALRHHRRRADDLLLVEAVRDVAVVGGGEPLGVNAPADLTDLLLALVFGHGLPSEFVPFSVTFSSRP